MKCFNVKEFKINISNYISDSSYNDIKKSFEKNKEKINDLSNRIIPKYNQFIDFINQEKKENDKEKFLKWEILLIFFLLIMLLKILMLNKLKN
jgi:hypothetical protein